MLPNTRSRLARVAPGFLWSAICLQGTSSRSSFKDSLGSSSACLYGARCCWRTQNLVLQPTMTHVNEPPSISSDSKSSFMPQRSARSIRKNSTSALQTPESPFSTLRRSKRILVSIRTEQSCEAKQRILNSTLEHSAHVACANGNPQTSDADWKCLKFQDGYVRLDLTLLGGQSFRWRDMGRVSWRSCTYREFAGVFRRSLVILRQLEEESLPSNADPVWYRVAVGAEEHKVVDAGLRDFFRADVDLRPIVETFSNADERFRAVFPYFCGARMLRQDPVECLFAFICSSNNNVKRITGMVNHIAERHGVVIGTYKERKFYSFPAVETLAAEAKEEDLRKAGFGYRAKYIVQTASKLHALGGESYLTSLRERPRGEVANALVEFDGIGRKVAGCIALMSLNCADEIPCDTHVWQIAKRDYLPNLRSKTLTDKAYTAVGEHFRQLFGKYAGWAHNYLFIAELSDFKHRLPNRGSREVAPPSSVSGNASEKSTKIISVSAMETLGGSSSVE